MLNLLMHLSFISLFIGMYLVGSAKNRIGWHFRIVGWMGIIASGFVVNLSPLIFWGGVSAVVDMIGYVFSEDWEESDEDSEREG